MKGLEEDEICKESLLGNLEQSMENLHSDQNKIMVSLQRNQTFYLRNRKEKMK